MLRAGVQDSGREGNAGFCAAKIPAKILTEGNKENEVVILNPAVSFCSNFHNCRPTSFRQISI
jgi:hypothetical protein